MEYKITITCHDAAELADIASRLSAVDVTEPPVADAPAETPKPAAIEEPTPAVAEAPAPEVADEAAPEQAEVTVSLDELRKVGRKLVTAQRSAEVQKVLQAHGVRLMSKLPADIYPAVYAELNALLEGKADAPA